MDNYILLDWKASLGLEVAFILLLAALCLIACNWQTERNKNRRLRRRNEFLRNRLSIAQHELYRVNYKLPEVDEDVQM